MPLPWLIGAAVLSGIYGMDKRDEAKRYANEAEDYNSRTRELENGTNAKIESALEQTKASVDELAKTKLLIQTKGLDRFENCYRQLKRIEKRNGRTGSSLSLDLSDAQLDQLRGSCNKAIELTSGGINSMAAGTLTAIGAYGFAGAFGTASTGMAISGLAGAAAQNATLAWLGGGAAAAGGLGMVGGMAVLGGLFIRPTLAFSGYSAAKKAKAARDDAASEYSMAKHRRKQGDVFCEKQEAIKKFVDEFDNVFYRCHGLFLSTVGEMERIINGTDVRNFSQRQITTIYAAETMSKVMYKFVNAPLIKNEEISDESRQLLESGRRLPANYG